MENSVFFPQTTCFKSPHNSNSPPPQKKKTTYPGLISRLLDLGADKENPPPYRSRGRYMMPKNQLRKCVFCLGVTSCFEVSFQKKKAWAKSLIHIDPMSVLFEDVNRCQVAREKCSNAYIQKTRPMCIIDSWIYFWNLCKMCNLCIYELIHLIYNLFNLDINHVCIIGVHVCMSSDLFLSSLCISMSIYLPILWST